MSTSYVFSGHESFPCRYPWIPKAVAALQDDPSLFREIDHAMVRLGIGKNMVHALRFWLRTMGVCEQSPDRTTILTAFGTEVFAVGGFDPYLEDATTLWLLHWKLCTGNENPLFAWDYLFNRHSAREIIRSEIVSVFLRESQQLARPLAKSTIAQHFDVFLHTYLSRTKNALVLEDSLDCPLTELALIDRVGDTVNSQGALEPAYGFRQEPKPDISNDLFVYALMDFWDRTRPGEQTLSLSEVSTASGSPGRVFRLPEDDVRNRLSIITTARNAPFSFNTSALMEQLIRASQFSTESVGGVYSGSVLHA